MTVEVLMVATQKRHKVRCKVGTFWRTTRRALQLCPLVKTKNKPDNLKKDCSQV